MMFDFACRNLALFFKDRMTVLLSFLAEGIVVVLYILFIRKNMIEAFSIVKDIELLIDVWMIAGILGITSVTTTMGAYGIMVEDKAKHIQRDFLTSPIRKYALVGGYMGGAVMIGLFMSVLLFLISAVYILHQYRIQLANGQGVSLLLLFLLITLSNSALVLLVVSFLKSSNALASCCTILGALIGFLTGIYIPMGNLPEGVKTIIKVFPVSHAVVLLRQLLMEPLIDEKLNGLDGYRAQGFMQYLGVQYVWEGNIVTKKESIIILVTTAIFFFVLSIFKEQKTVRF